GGETGRRRGLKIPRPRGHVGSSPTPGTNKNNDLQPFAGDWQVHDPAKARTRPVGEILGRSAAKPYGGAGRALIAPGRAPSHATAPPRGLGHHASVRPNG